MRASKVGLEATNSSRSLPWNRGMKALGGYSWLSPTMTHRTASSSSSGKSPASGGPCFLLLQVPRRGACSWSGATRSVKNSLRSIAPVILAALALPGFRSVIICPNTDDARSSTSSALGYSLLCRGASIGNTRLGWASLASTITHLDRMLSALFPVLEIELALPDATKLAHPEM